MSYTKGRPHFEEACLDVHSSQFAEPCRKPHRPTYAAGVSGCQFVDMLSDGEMHHLPRVENC